MLVETIPVGLLQCNCTILACERTREAIVIDPGDEADSILDVVRANGLEVRYVLHTHAHLDHVMGTGDVVRETGARPRLHPGDVFLYENLEMQGRLLGMSPAAAPPLSEPLRDAEEIRFGDETLRILHTPGHTPGSVCMKVGSLLLSGDTLFRGSIGRTDLWGGDFDTIMTSLRDKILPLEDDVRVIAGHGPDTKIGIERKKNPFLLEIGSR